MTPRVVTLSVVGKTEDAMETSWMTGNDCKHRDEPRRVASDFVGLRHMPLQEFRKSAFSFYSPNILHVPLNLVPVG